ncbi:MAG: hypothetical protein LIO65_03620 [Odoribacter sp.]|nr:hypothetical protein [Odoribacter sp.]
MKKILILILGIWITVCFSSCKDPFENEIFSAYDDEPAGALIASWDDHSDWVKLLKKQTSITLLI